MGTWRVELGTEPSRPGRWGPGNDGAQERSGAWARRHQEGSPSPMKAAFDREGQRAG